MGRVHLGDLDGERDESLAWVVSAQGVTDPAQLCPTGGGDRICSEAGYIEGVSQGRRQGVSPGAALAPFGIGSCTALSLIPDNDKQQGVLSPEKLLRKVSAGGIALPLVRIENSAKRDVRGEGRLDGPRRLP
jgi:hypothetical protein